MARKTETQSEKNRTQCRANVQEGKKQSKVLGGWRWKRKL